MPDAESRAESGRPAPNFSIPLTVGTGLIVASAIAAVLVWNLVPLWTRVVLVSVAGAGAALLLLAAIIALRANARGPRPSSASLLHSSKSGGSKPGGRPAERASSPTNDDAEETDQDNGAPRMFLWAPIGLGILTLFFVAAVVLLNVAGIPLPEFVLPMLLIGGVVALLLTIAIVAVVFSHRKMSSSLSPLGLPEGSVRAIIALCLILIFAIMAVFLYATLLKGDVRTSRMLTIGEINQLPEDTQVVAVSRAGESDPETGETLFNAQLSVPANEASQDFAKQLLTTVSTLVVAISAFYFGAKTGATPEGGADRTQPSTVAPPTLRLVSPPSPAVRPSGGSVLPILVETRPRGEPVLGEIESGDPTGMLAPTDEPGQWEYRPSPTPQPVVILRFWLANSADTEQRLEVRAPLPENETQTKQSGEGSTNPPGP